MNERRSASFFLYLKLREFETYKIKTSHTQGFTTQVD